MTGPIIIYYVPGVSVFSDDFNRADGALTTPWDYPFAGVGAVSAGVVSNQLRFNCGNNGGDNIIVRANYTPAANESLTFTVVNWTFDANVYLYPIIRMSGGATPTGYCAEIFGTPVGGIFARIKNLSGALPPVSIPGSSDGSGLTINPGDTITLSAVGSIITLSINGVVVASATSSTHSAAGVAGFAACSYTGAGSKILALDNVIVRAA